MRKLQPTRGPRRTHTARTPHARRTRTHAARARRFSSEWEKTVTRLGRWIDFKNDYKTMDRPFMESVWWVRDGRECQLHE